MNTAQRYRTVADEVAEVCAACGRAPGSVRLVAVSKTVGSDEVACALQAGARDFGENRPDQIVAKAPAFPQARWHFIGNIQSRRIPDIVGAATLIHSLYQLRHAEVQDVLVEVNVSGEASKSGAAPEEAHALVRSCAALPHVRVCGLMTMAPQGDLSVAADTFRGLADLAGEIRAQLPADEAAAFIELSMGMSEDWREAIACGATIVRVGRAIFSESFQE